MSEARMERERVRGRRTGGKKVEERSRMGTNSISWTDMRHRKPRTGKKTEEEEGADKHKKREICCISMCTASYLAHGGWWVTSPVFPEVDHPEMTSKVRPFPSSLFLAVPHSASDLKHRRGVGQHDPDLRVWTEQLYNCINWPRERAGGF